MLCGSIDFPDEIISALKDNKLVVFAGAGVSMGPPACLRDFKDLANKVAEGTKFSKELEESREPVDQFLGQLEANEVNIRDRIVQLLQPPGHNPLHVHLVRLFKNLGDVRIVTTNFEHLFETACVAAWREQPRVYDAPALPLGDRFTGIVHVHGNITDHESMVITDADFGRAYLTEGWAQRFLVGLFRAYTVLFVGYSHGDTVLSYLARALPPATTTRRYSLVQESDDPAYWKYLGIAPIPFGPHKKGEFFNLDDGVRSLAEFRQRGVLEWKREIQAIARMRHPLPRDKHDHLNQLLREEWAVEVFAEHARSIDWLTWLQCEGHIAPLFKADTVDNCALEFARTLPRSFVLQYPEALQLLCAQNGLRLNHAFWHNIARELSLSNPPPENQVYCSWLTLLLSCDTGYKDPHMLAWLAKRASELNLPWCLLDIYEAMCHSSLDLKPGFHLSEPDEESSPRVSMGIDLKADWSHLHEVWTLIKPHLDELAEPLTRFLIAQMEQRFRIYVYYGKANSHWDPDSMSRSAIEPHEQDKYPRPVHALIDALRDSLLHVHNGCPKDVLPLGNRLVRSKVPLLRRLSVYLISNLSGFSANAKLDWLMEFVSLDDAACHHETFHFLANCFSNGDVENQERVVCASLKLEVEESSRMQVEHFQFTLLIWLNEHAPDCRFVQDALERLRERHPTWLAPRHADFNHYTSGGWVHPRSPWTKEQLLSRPSGMWIDDMLKFQSRDRLGEGDGDVMVEISREGLWGAITQASDERPEWGVELAHALVDRAEWDTDLWYGLIDSWEHWSRNEQTVVARLRVLTHRELLLAHSQRTARLLRAFVEVLQKENREALIKCIDLANEVSLTHWEVLERDLKDQHPEKDWVQFAINQPAGVLTEYWVRSHSYVRNSDSIPKDLSLYEGAFQRIVDDDTFVGGAGRAILFRYLSYLQNAMPSWTRTHLLPMLSSENESIFRQSWHGILSSRRITDDLWAEIRGSVLSAASRTDVMAGRNGDIPSIHKFPEEFTDFFVDCVAAFENDPLNEWIPSFYQNTSEYIHVQFAQRITRVLEESSEEERRSYWQRWLRNHWEVRLQGIPTALCAKESGVMLNWLLYLEFDFARAVSVAVTTREFNLEHTHFFWDLGESELPARFPADTARLLCHVLKLYSESKNYEIYDLSPLLKKTRAKYRGECPSKRT